MGDSFTFCGGFNGVIRVVTSTSGVGGRHGEYQGVESGGGDDLDSGHADENIGPVGTPSPAVGASVVKGVGEPAPLTQTDEPGTTIPVATRRDAGPACHAPLDQEEDPEENVEGVTGMVAPSTEGGTLAMDPGSDTSEGLTMFAGSVAALDQDMFNADDPVGSEGETEDEQGEAVAAARAGARESPEGGGTESKEQCLGPTRGKAHGNDSSGGPAESSRAPVAVAAGLFGSTASAHDDASSQAVRRVAASRLDPTSVIPAAATAAAVRAIEGRNEVRGQGELHEGITQGRRLRQNSQEHGCLGEAKNKDDGDGVGDTQSRSGYLISCEKETQRRLEEPPRREDCQDDEAPLPSLLLTEKTRDGKDDDGGDEDTLKGLRVAIVRRGFSKKRLKVFMKRAAELGMETREWPPIKVWHGAGQIFVRQAR